MKILKIIIMLLMLTSCSFKDDLKDLEESNKKIQEANDKLDKILHQLISLDSCLKGANETQFKFFKLTKQNLPKNVRLELIKYCGGVSDTEKY